MELSLKIIIEKSLSLIDGLTDKMADFVISKPKENENIQSAVTFGASALATRGITIGAISTTETLSSIGAATCVVQSAAKVASAGTEFLAAPVTAVGTIAASESTPLIAAGVAVLTFSLVGGKIASRAAGHACNYLDKDKSVEDLQIEDISKELSSPMLKA